MGLGSHRRVISLLLVMLLVVSVHACRIMDRAGDLPEPWIEAAPLGQSAGQWKLITSDTVKLTVMAPGAEKVKLLYKPVVAVERHAELKMLSPPAEGRGEFVLEWTPGPDFVGDVWAEVYYFGGAVKKTEPLPLAAEEAISSQAGEIPFDRVGGSVKTDESARSDKLAGGRIEQAPFVEGAPRIWITINAPAFRLTLWQARKELKAYPIGIGRRGFPLPIAERKASEIIWNPEWVPPDSRWVEESVEPGERIEADDPRNPLGKVKIRLGGAILIHEAAKPSDIGRLVSHGCVRMLTEDIFDLTEKIVAARRLPVTKERIEHVKMNTERLAVKLDPPVWVDINYDTQVIEGGVLHLYPDVYHRGTGTPENLRAELARGDVGAEQLDEQTLKQMLARVSRAEEFRISLADIKAGRRAAGHQSPLTDYSVETKPKDTRRSP
ncbi:MAG: L,D-transpeptidase [Gammaproteobacteria bacterium]